MRLPLLLALMITALNAAKPVVIDDTAYLQLARQVSKTPLTPYGPPPGFEMIWYQTPDYAFDTLLPPVLPYWLGLGMACFGENIVLQKLWLFPILWLFTASLGCVLIRFCPKNANLLLVMSALSPTILPSVNLMLDVPAMAFSLAGFCCLIRPIRFGAVWGGLLLGLAMQTKYSSLGMPIILLLYGWRFGCLRRAITMTAIASVLFVAWEALMAKLYGSSHFLLHASYQNANMYGLYEWRYGLTVETRMDKLAALWDSKERLIAPLFGNLGGIFPAFAALGLIGMRRIWLAIAILVLICVHALVNCTLPVASESFSLFSIGFNCLGGVSLFIILLCAWKGRHTPDGRFLALWFLWELLCYFALSPFGCVRRMMGIVVVGTLLCGRSLEGSEPPRRLVRIAAAVGIALGLFFYAVDLSDGLVEKHAAERAFAEIRQRDDKPRIHFAGHWGFQWHCGELGMKEIWPGRSRFEAGDWLVIPNERPHSQTIALSAGYVERVTEFSLDWKPGVATIMDYYCGKIPMRVIQGPRMRVEIYRVLKPFEAKSGE